MRSARELVVAWRWPFALIAVCAILVFGGLRMTRMLLPGPFQRADVTNRFISSFPDVSRTRGGLLELATVKVTETFSRSDTRTIGWGWIPLGETISQVRVPVTYRYHLRLSGKWDVRIDGQICRVIAPAIEPSPPASVHLDQIERRTDRGWARFDSSEQMQLLEQELMKQLEIRATEIPKIADVREACRQTTREFVQTWLLRDQEWRVDAFHIVDVRFQDEIAGAGPEEKSRE